jgi:hypothetical protein
MGSDSNQLKLIYILPVGENWKNEYIYEFLFSDTTENVEGADWDVRPSSGRPTPPYKGSIMCVGKVLTEVKFDVIQNSDVFCVYDSIDGVIGLGWENIDDYEQYPELRLKFFFGDSLKSVKDSLYSKDIILEIKDVKNEK